MIMSVIEEYNYIPNNSARNLKRVASKTIAVLIKGISNPFFASMIRILEQEIQCQNYLFVLHRVDEKEDEIDVALELIKEKRLKGIVFLGGYFVQRKEKMEQLQVPFVLSTIGVNNYSSVTVDDFSESYKMTRYLCSLGHRHILILASQADDESIGKLRLEGFKKALLDTGIDWNEDLCVYMEPDIESYSIENGYQSMKRALNDKKKFTAVYGISDRLAIGACKAIFDAGKSVPEDYSVAGFDGIDIAGYYHPSITTIRQPVEEMAYATIKLLFDLIKKKTNHQQLVFKGELTIGQSTKRIG